MSRLLSKYPDRVPVYVEADTILNKNKFLVPRTMTVGQFTYVVRKRMDLQAHEALFMFVNNVLPPVSADFDTLHREHANEDGLLYVKYGKENTFGGYGPLAAGVVASVMTYMVLGTNPEPEDSDHEDVRSLLSLFAGIVVSGLQ